MLLSYLDRLATEPGTLLEWTAVADVEPVDYPVPPTSNQLIHLSAAGPSTWLAATFDVPGPIDTPALETAFAAWLPRHDALHSSFARSSTGAVSVRVVAETDIRLAARPPVQATTPDELRSLLGRRLDQACDPFAFAPYFLGAISRTDRSTVVCGFDHAICDAWSITIAVTELNELYRATCEGGPLGAITASVGLPEPGSFLSYSAREAGAARVSSTDIRIRAWQNFFRAAGDDMPHFPLDLGLTRGSPHPQADDVRLVLGAEEIDAVHRRCRAEGHTLFGALLASIGLVSADATGRRHTRMIFPVHTRREPRHHTTFGWLIANAPATVTAASDLAIAARAADETIRAGQALAELPAVRVLEDVGAQLTRTRNGLFSVSYTDYRNLPGGSRWDTELARPENPIQLSRASPVDDVQMWFTRTERGLALRTRFPGTDTAPPTMRKFLDQLVETIIGRGH